MNQLCSCNDQRVTAIRLSEPWCGVWVAEVDFDVPTAMSGLAVIKIGTRVLRGVFDVTRCGTYLLRSKAFVVGGANGWTTRVVARDYQNDAGVDAALVIADAARDCGETLGAVSLTRATLDKHFVRTNVAASEALVAAIGDDAWWIDDDGATTIGRRAASEITAQYEVLSYDSRYKIATVAADDATAVRVGSVLRDAKLPAPLLVRQLETVVDNGRVRITAWGAEDSVAPAFRGVYSRVLRAVKAMARSAFPDYAYRGKYRYRVVRRVSNRFELQAIDSSLGLPDLLPVVAWSGAGTWYDITPGSTVLVEFIEGRATMPIITHYCDRDDIGWRPINTLIDATTSITLGDAAKADPVAKQRSTQQAIDNLVQRVNLLLAVIYTAVPGTTVVTLPIVSSPPSLANTPLPAQTVVATSKVVAE